MGLRTIVHEAIRDEIIVIRPFSVGLSQFQDFLAQKGFLPRHDTSYKHKLQVLGARFHDQTE